MILVANHTFTELRNRLNIFWLQTDYMFGVKSKMVAKNNEKSNILSL